jgi:NTE family protein
MPNPPDQPRRALVLSGGSIKGAFQAGAIAEVLRSGFVPNVIYGISVGALNGAFLADRSGRRAGNANQPVPWPEIGAELVDFWTQCITRPSAIIRKHGTSAIVWETLWNDFNGLVDTKPLRNLITAEITEANLRASPATLTVGAVNLVTGDIRYATPGSPNIVAYVYASTAIPIAMPIVEIAGVPYYDGGLRDIAPLGTAINEGATEIVCIVCQPRSANTPDFNRKNLLKLVSRIEDIVTTEIVENDLARVKFVNDVIRVHPDSPLVLTKDYRHVPVIPIRPTDPIDVSLESFNSGDIQRMVDYGKYAAQQALKKPPEVTIGLNGAS